MAYIGVRKPYIAPLKANGTYEDPILVAKATSFEETPNTSEATLYGDDALAESDRGVNSAALTLGTTDFPQSAATAMFGHGTTEGEETANIDDNTGYCGFAVIGKKQVNGVKTYEARVYPKTQWSEPATTLNTRGESTEFQTPSTSGVAMANDDGDWRYKQEFPTEAEAISYIQSKFPKTSG